MHELDASKGFPVFFSLCVSHVHPSFILACFHPGKQRETVDLLLNANKGAQIVLKLKTNNTAWAI